MLDEKNSYGTSSTIVYNYFTGLMRHATRIANMQSDDVVRQDVVLCVFMAIAIVETFINCHFRNLIEDEKHKHCRDRILKDLKSNTPLDRKLKQWPKLLFNRGLDLNDPAVKRFMNLKKLRNDLTHFTNSYDTFEAPGLEIRGLADISAFQDLSPKAAMDSVEIVFECIGHILLICGTPDDEVKHAQHLWLGIPPTVDN